MQTTDTFYSSSQSPMTARRARARSGILSRSNVLVALGLVITMLMGGYFRFVGLNWDDFVGFHPDERFMTSFVATQMGRGWLSFTDGTDIEMTAYCAEQYPATRGVGPFFDARCSDMNPHNIGAGHFAYGTLPVFTAWTAGHLIDDISAANGSTTSWASGDGITLVWRTLSAVYDMVAIVAVFLIATKLRDKWMGLVAAALYAGAVLPIQISHFATADSMASMWVTITILFSVRAAADGKWIDFALAGAAFGAALASRFNIFPLVIIIIWAAVYRVLPLFNSAIPGTIRSGTMASAFAKLVLAGIVTVLVFRIANPYAFVGPGFLGLTPNSRWLDDLFQARLETSSQNDAPPNWQWAGRTPYVFAFSNMVLWGMGVALGVMGWLSLIWASVRMVRARRGALMLMPLVLWVLVYFGWVGGNFVMSMRYYLPLYSSFAVLAAWGLVELVARNRVSSSRLRSAYRVLATLALGGVVGFTLLWAAMFTNVYRHMATFTQLGQWTWQYLPGDFAMTIEGAPENQRLMNIALFNTNGVQNDNLSNSTHLFPDNAVSNIVTAPGSGVVREITAPRIGSLAPNAGNTTLRLTVMREGSPDVLATAELSDDFPYDPLSVGSPYTIPLDQPLTVQQGDRFSVIVEVIGNPLVTSGTIVTWEGAWDEPVPSQVCTLPVGVTLEDDPPPGLLSAEDCNRRNASATLVTTNQLDLAREDDVAKLEDMLRVLDSTDYIMIGTNRRYDSQSRNSLRWPLTNAYYDALFGGRLGFELVETFHESFELGPLRVSDQNLPTYQGFRGNDLLNEFESEEAFSVYDHPTIFVFRKSENYDPAAVREILGAVNVTRVYDANPYNQCPEDPDLYFCNTQIVNVATVSTGEASLAPTALMLTPQAREIQENGGTWSERFDSDSPVNTSIPVTIAAWYGALFLFGAAAFPALYVLFPALADRGYGFSKFIGMFLVAFGTWYLASVRVPVWSQAGVIGGMVVMALVSLALVWRHRGDYLRWVRAHWKRLLAIETLTFIMFMLFVGYRLLNPDLWHDSFGGEKPMDFGYFNGVLRSTVFPAIDPWYSGGFINYYYFGFVIVGTPVLLLKMLPSIAYNLILPTLFAVTAIGAFSVAFSLVDALKDRLSDGTWKRRANKWLAGIAAMLLCVVLGNLDTPRVMLTGLANAGGYQQPQDLQTFLMDEYTRENGTIGDEATMRALTERAEANNLGDRLRFEAWVIQEQVSSVFNGVMRLVRGEPVYVSPDRWFWGPSRVLAETPGVEGSAITEMPAFTFIYADLHAHMISMPLQLFVFAFVLNEVLNAGNDSRRRGQRWLALATGAIVVGMLRATNTWDWITYMLLGVLGLGFAWWLKWRVLSRDSLVDVVMRVGGFIVISALAVLPFTTWYASTYNSIRPWTDGKTPLWAFFIIHGLFLFLVVSLLAWDTSRWLQESRVRSLRGSCLVLLIGGAAAVLVFTGALVLAALDWQVTLIVLPMLVWVGLLFFRANQTRPMQFMLALAGLALGLILGVEYIVLDGDIGRQNTVFKFYMQVWLMFSVIGGVAVALLWRSSSEWRAAPRTAWTAVLVVLVTIASLFPIMAARGKASFRMDAVTNAEGVRAEPPLTLDGMMYMTWARRYEGDNDNLALDPTLSPFALNGDYAMIRWLQENVQGSPVIIEGLGEDTQYRWNGRISINTGLPAVVGWNFHQRQQRTLDPMGRMVEMRNANVNGFYETGDLPSAWSILRHYRVEYIILGRYERALYGAIGLAKFDRMEQLGLIERVFDADGSIIYVVNQDAPFDPAQLDVG